MLYFGFQLGICRLAFQVRSDFRMHDMKYASTLLLTKGSTGNLNCSYCPIFFCTVFQAKKSHAPSQWKQRSACHEKEKLLESLPAPCMQVSGAKKNKLYISTKKREIFWFFPWGKKNVVVLGRLDTLGVVVHDLRIRHTRRSSANLGHAVEGHVLLAV